MPQADQLSSTSKFVRALIYGPGKSRKTTWAVHAANAGYRVLMFSLERGDSIILSQVRPEFQKNIYILQAHDGPRDAFAATSLVQALKHHKFYINETTRQCTMVQREGFTEIDMTKFGQETIVLIDTWTAFVFSLTRQYALENNIDLTEAEKQDWPGYGWCGRLATWTLGQLRTLPCHAIVVAHSTQYEAYKKDPLDPKKQGPLKWSRRQPISTSNPHGMSLNDKFDHMLFFHTARGQTFIDTRGDDDSDAGSRFLPPQEYKFEDLPFALLAHLNGNTPPTQMETPWNFPTVAPLIARPAAVPTAVGTHAGVSTAPIIQATPRPSFLLPAAKR